jgi:hypothetical protein
MALRFSWGGLPAGVVVALACGNCASTPAADDPCKAVGGHCTARYTYHCGAGEHGDVAHCEQSNCCAPGGYPYDPKYTCAAQGGNCLNTVDLCPSGYHKLSNGVCDIPNGEGPLTLCCMLNLSSTDAAPGEADVAAPSDATTTADGPHDAATTEADDAAEAASDAAGDSADGDP